MYLEILTPEKTVFSGEIQLIKVPGSGGSFEVMNNHAPIISTLDQGEVRVVVNEDTIKTYTIDNGVIQVVANKIMVMAETLTEAKIDRTL
jgi:F-type H+-transporting ATPase subunit epsilon